MLVATCPSREELLDYAVGKLSDEAAESLAGHLDSCENCQAELAALSDADDTLVARLRGPLPADPILDEPECSRAVAIARAVAENDASATNLPRLLGEYQLSAKLGSGGMGTVYKALHTKLGRVVALKVLTRARTHDPAAVARFEREMQAVGQLDHRHIVRAHDAREIDGTPILVMEYLDGLDLGEIVRRAGVPALAGNLPSPSGRGAGGEGGERSAPCIPIPDAAELARQTAIGLQTIHEHGLVHRDIMPSNLMLTADGVVKILDLGMARLRPDVPSGEEMTATGQGMGTADYMAPEQASDSRAVDIRADIYSLGCTLYKLLTGRAPFSGREYRTAFDKMTAHVHAAPPPVRDFAPAMPEGLATVLDRMLAKNPAARFTTPAEVADALAPYCTGADLAALLKRAAASPPLPPGEGRGEGGSDLPSTANKGPRGEQHNLPSPSAKGARSEGRRWKRFVGQLVLLLLAGGLGFALAIILRIHKDGKDTTIELPDGSNTRVSANGQVDVELPNGTNSGQATKAQAAVPSPKSSISNSAPNPFATRGQAEVAPTAAPLPTVRVTQPVICDLCDYEEYTGRIVGEAAQQIIPPEKKEDAVEIEVYCKEGMTVNRGDLLAKFVPAFGDSRFEAAWRARDNLENELRLEGFARLRVIGGPPPSDAELNAKSAEDAERMSKLEEKLRAVRQDEKRIARDLPGERIVASFSGKVGRVLEGLRPGMTSHPITTITAVPISVLVDFDVPDSTVLAYRRLPNRKPDWELSLPVVCGLADDKGFPYRGKVVSVAKDIDPQTHTQRWQAVVPNKDGIFMPGMSVFVRVVTSEPQKVMLIPPECKPNFLLSENRESRDAEVRIVNDQNVVETHKVKIERRQFDGFIPVIEGLKANDWIVLVPPRGGRGRRAGERWNVGDTVAPEKVTTPPPPWAAISVPPSVTVAHPIAREVTDYQDFTGHIEAVQTAEIRARASGILDKVCFKPGMSVKKGDVLFEIDPRLYQAELDQAAGAVKQAQIRLNARKLDFDRIQVLAKNKAVSQEEIDKARSEREEAIAAVQTAEAALNVARVRLDYTNITAPFDGRISRSMLDAGNLITADKTVLATLASTDPMYVYFDIDERTALVLRRNAAKNPATSFPVECGLPGEEGFPHQTKVESAEGRVDPATGTIRLRAVLPNKDGLLMPGMFVRVRLDMGTTHKSLFVPESAGGRVGGPYAPYRADQQYLFIVNDQNILEARRVS